MNSDVIDNENFPNSSADLVLMAPHNTPSAAGEDKFTAEDYRTALRMMVGAALEGGDELSRRIRVRLNITQRMEQEIGAPVPGLQDMDSSPLLYTAIGLLFKTPDYLNQGLKTVDQITTRAASLVSRLTRPISHSRILRPVRRRYKDLVYRSGSAMDSLEANGRAEASLSRTLVRQQVNDETIEEILAYLVEKAKLRDLIAEQGLAAADDATTEIRLRSAAVDSSLDNIVDNLLRRKKLNTPPAGSSS